MTTRIIVFGSSGVGKSSLIKLITNIKIDTSDASRGCTENVTPYLFNFENATSGLNISNEESKGETTKILGDIIIHDTPGLNESEQGATVGPMEAIEKLFDLIKSLRNGLNLLIYVKKKGPTTQTDDKNLQLVKFMINKNVPCVCVITECETSMGWWEKEKKETSLSQFKFKDGCSVCCIDLEKLEPDDASFYVGKRDVSKIKLLNLIKKNISPKPHVLYDDHTGFMKLFAEIWYFIKHKTLIKWFFGDENEIHDTFIKNLKDSGIEVSDAEKMAKKIEISRKT